MFNDWKLNDGSKRVIRLLTPEELKVTLPGTMLLDIFGKVAVVGKDDIDTDTRGGYLAYGRLLNAD